MEDEWSNTSQSGLDPPLTVTPDRGESTPTSNTYTPLIKAEADTPSIPLEAIAAAVWPSLYRSILPQRGNYWTGLVTGAEPEPPTTFESRIPTVNTRTTIPQVITVPATEEDNHSIDSPIQPVDIHTTALNRKLVRLYHNPEAEDPESEDSDADCTSSTNSETHLYD